MNRQNERIVFKAHDYTGVMQDKYPPQRIFAATIEPATAGKAADMTPRVSTNTTRTQNDTAFPAVDRPKHHGSETRQTLQIAGRVKAAIKSEVVRLAKRKGWTESKTVAVLVEQGIAGNIAEQLGVSFKTTIQDAVTTQMQKENSRAGNLALEAFYSAEETRILVIYLIRMFLGSDIDILPQIIKDSQEQARENVSLSLHTRGKQN